MFHGVTECLKTLVCAFDDLICYRLPFCECVLLMLMEYYVDLFIDFLFVLIIPSVYVSTALIKNAKLVNFWFYDTERFFEEILVQNKESYSQNVSLLSSAD